MAKDIRVDIGFAGGGGTAIEVPEEQLSALTQTLKGGDAGGWHSVASSDGSEFLVDLSKVVFVRVASSNRSIGFAHA